MFQNDDTLQSKQKRSNGRLVTSWFSRQNSERHQDRHTLVRESRLFLSQILLLAGRPFPTSPPRVVGWCIGTASCVSTALPREVHRHLLRPAATMSSSDAPMGAVQTPQSAHTPMQTPMSGSIPDSQIGGVSEGASCCVRDSDAGVGGGSCRWFVPSVAAGGAPSNRVRVLVIRSHPTNPPLCAQHPPLHPVSSLSTGAGVWVPPFRWPFAPRDCVRAASGVVLCATLLPHSLRILFVAPAVHLTAAVPATPRLHQELVVWMMCVIGLWCPSLCSCPLTCDWPD